MLKNKIWRGPDPTELAFTSRQLKDAEALEDALWIARAAHVHNLNATLHGNRAEMLQAANALQAALTRSPGVALMMKRAGLTARGSALADFYE